MGLPGADAGGVGQQGWPGPCDRRTVGHGVTTNRGFDGAQLCSCSNGLLAFQNIVN